MSKTKTPPAKPAILEVLKVEPQAPVAQIAVSAGVGRSTAGELLAQLESDGEVRRTAGGRDGNRRLPDLWSLADGPSESSGTQAQPASAPSDDKPAAANGEAHRRVKAGGGGRP